MKYKPSRVFLIINPNSGIKNRFFRWLNRIFGWNKIKKSKSLDEKVIQIQSQFENEGIGFEYAYTKYPGHAKDLAHQESAKGIDIIIAMGGDGTINEVVNGMVHSESRLGVIPYGTANVFGLSFDVPNDYLEACKRIIEGQSKVIDLGNINGHFFICMGGVGFDAYIIKKADKRLKKIIGGLSYVMISMVEYFRYKFNPIIFKVDNDSELKKGYFLFICNTKYYGGKFIISDKIDPTDGLLDICLIKDKGLFTAIKCSVQLAMGKLRKSDVVEKFQCKQIYIDASGRHRIHGDAEYVSHTPANVQIYPKAITIIY